MKIHKQNKFLFYIKGYSDRFFPTISLEKKLNSLYQSLNKDDKYDLEFRVDYYNKINVPIRVKRNGTKIKDLKHPKTPKSYYFDTYEYAKYFDENLEIDYAFGDINTVLPIPMITKSRPVSDANQNNILLNLDKSRHFISVNDEIPFDEKNDLMIGRCAVYQEHRYKFFDKYFNHPLCDLGQVNTRGGNQEWLKPKISIPKHLKYKFILSLEGNDVATNLKWIMSSNSLTVMPDSKIESWYMEGTLIPDEHYISVSQDYGNLEEKLSYYIEHTKEAKEVLNNAKIYRKKFMNEDKENLISLLVLKKYFEKII